MLLLVHNTYSIKPVSASRPAYALHVVSSESGDWCAIIGEKRILPSPLSLTKRGRVTLQRGETLSDLPELEDQNPPEIARPTLPSFGTAIKSLYYASVYGLSFFFFTFFVNYYLIAGRQALPATVLNMAAVVIFLFIDKLEVYLAYRFNERIKSGEGSPIIHALKAYFDWGGISAKTGLYWFYVVLLFLMAIVAADPDFPFLSTYRYYFDTVSYGLLILITYDKFLDRFLREMLAGTRV